MRTLVLGLGNEYAGDDAIGVLAVRALRGELAKGADVVESAASGLALLEVFAGYDRAVIADSIRTGPQPGGHDHRGRARRSGPGDGTQPAPGWHTRARRGRQAARHGLP